MNSRFSTSAAPKPRTKAKKVENTVQITVLMVTS